MKKNKLRVFCLLMAVVMLLSMLPMAVWAVDAEEVKKVVTEIIKDDYPEVLMSDINSKSELSSYVNGKWLSNVEKQVKSKLGISVSLSAHLEDFEAAVPKNKEDPDGEVGSAIVVIRSKYWGKDEVFTTAIIEADKWGKPVLDYDEEDDDDDDDKAYFGGKDGLGVQLVWKNDSSADRPNGVIVKVYNKDKLYRTRTVKGSKWYAEWDEVKSGKNWDVDLSSVPNGYKYSVEKVEDTYFVITLTKTGDTSGNGAVTGGSQQVSGSKENPSTGAF